jgi:ribulose-phosphate 3-epimerase
MTVRLSASLLNADLAHLAEEVARVEAGGADLLHVDVMDGHFVPNLTIGSAVVAALRRVTRLPLDVHLMMTDPDRYLEAFVEAGAAMVTVHVEVLPHLHRTLGRIRELGALAGVALNPSTPMDALSEVVDNLDHLLVMSVNPGFGGQTFIPRSVDKVASARALLGARESQASIGVDGGVDRTNARRLVEAGATILVAGAALFGNDDPAQATRALRAAAEAV